MSQLVLITRPVEQAKAFEVEVEGLGFEALVAPLLEIEAVAYEVPDLERYDGLVFTSVNGVRFFDHGGVSRDIPVFAVNEQTQDALRDIGYRDVVNAYGNAADVEAALDGRWFLHVRGADVAHVFPENVAGLVVYRAKVVDGFDEAVVAAFRGGKISVVTLFSARTARQFMDLIEQYDLTDSLASIKVLLISDDLIRYVHTYSWSECLVADAPNRHGMIEGLKRIYSDE